MLPDRSIESRPINWFNPENKETETNLVVPTPSLHKLLVEAFDALKEELSTKGNTPEFLRLRQSHGDKLRDWWGSKRLAFLQGHETGEKIDIGFEPWLKIGEGEAVHVSVAEDYATDDPILTIGHRTKQEENEITITANDERLDMFMYPPKITCKYREDPDESPNYEWEVVFRGPAITTFTRIRIHDDPNHVIPYIKQTETLDTSIFGIDRLGMLEHLGQAES
jgi:hypothetical protein